MTIFETLAYYFSFPFIRYAFIVGILVLFLVPMGIGKIRALKHEIDTDEYFQMQEKKL